MFWLLLQAEPSIDWERWLMQYGPMYVLFLLFVGALVKYGPGLIQSHKDMLKSVSESSAKTAECTERLTESMEANQMEHKRTQRALDHMAEAGKTDDKQHFTNAQQELRGGVRLGVNQ